MLNWNKEIILKKLEYEISLYLKDINYLKISNFKTKYLILFIFFSLSFFLIALTIIFLIQLDIYFSIAEILFWVDVVFFITLVILIINYFKMMRKIKRKYFSVFPEDIYKNVFEKVFKFENIIFDGTFLLGEHLAPSKRKYYFKFTIPNAAILSWFSVDSYISVNTGKYKKDTWWYTYNLKIELLKDSKLDEFKFGIGGKSKNNTSFISESIDFNNTFAIQSNNQVQTTRIFSPSTISNLLDLHKIIKNKYWYDYRNNNFLSYYKSGYYGNDQLTEINILGKFIKGNFKSDTKKIAQKLYKDFSACIGHASFVEALNIFQFKIILME